MKHAWLAGELVASLPRSRSFLLMKRILYRSRGAPPLAIAVANAVLNTCFDDTLDIGTLFQGTAVVVGRQCLPRGRPRRKAHQYPQVLSCL